MLSSAYIDQGHRARRGLDSVARGLMLLLSLTAASCDESSSGPAPPGDATVDAAADAPVDAAAIDCSTAGDFAPCPLDDGAGLCLGGRCVEWNECGADCNRVGPGFVLPDTNLRQCFGASPDHTDGTIPCPGTPGAPACGQTDYCGEDAQCGWDVAHPASARFSVPGAVADEPVVTDNVTGRIWQGCSKGQAGARCAGEAVRGSWFDATAWCDALSWGGFEDWEVPDDFELQSIVDYGTTSPAIDRAVFANAPSHFEQDSDQWWIECVWSSSDYARDPSVAWAMMVNSGDILEGSGTTYHLHDKAADGWEGCYVRCVRHADRPTRQRFIAMAWG